MSTTIDAGPRRATRAERLVFQNVRNAEVEYSRKLRKLSQFVLQTAREMFKGAGPNVADLFIPWANMMNGYSDIIQPWAHRVAFKMIHDVALRDMKAWRERAQEVSWNLEDVIRNAPIGLVMQRRLEDQIKLITSIPRDIAEEVHQMAVTSLYSGQRMGNISEMIMQRADTTQARANLIARTEVARTTTELTRSRAEYVGSDGYIWRTSHDEDVRPSVFLSPKVRAHFIGSHRALDGKYIRWDSPPVSGQRGERAHAGQIYNCFPGEVLAGPVPDVTAVFRAFYCGPIVVFNVGNSSIPVTPNHPVLTEKGWRMAYEVQEGDYLVQKASSGFCTIEEDIYRTHTSFNEIFEALSLAGADVESLLVDNFYGDMMIGNVNVVRPVQYLSLNSPESLFESVSNNMVSFADSRMERFIDSRLTQFREAGGSRVFDKLTAFGVRGDSHAGVHALTSPAQDNVAVAQYLLNNRAGDAHQTSNVGRTSTRVVFCDNRVGERLARVRGKSTQNFAGHVFTFECAATGEYTVSPERLIVQNCRCIPEVVIPEERRRVKSNWDWTVHPEL